MPKGRQSVLILFSTICFFEQRYIWLSHVDKSIGLNLVSSD